MLSDSSTSKEPNRQTSIWLSDDLLIAAKIKAVQAHLSLSEAVRRLIAKWVGEPN